MPTEEEIEAGGLALALMNRGEIPADHVSSSAFTRRAAKEVLEAAEKVRAAECTTGDWLRKAAKALER